MTRRIGNVIIIEREPENVCELCGKTAELRPYGPGGKRICFECMMKDEPAAKKRMKDLLFPELPLEN